MLSLCGAPPRGLCKAPHGSGVCWKQFMMLLAEVLVCGGVSPARPWSRRRDSRPCDGSAQCQGCQCTALSPQLLVALKFARRSAISAARCSAKHCLSSGVTLVSPLGCRTKGLPSSKGGLVKSLHHPAQSCARGAQSVKATGRLKWARWRWSDRP